MQKTIQFWLAGLLSLGAGFLVLSNPRGVATALQSGQQFLSATEHTAITGKA